MPKIAIEITGWRKNSGRDHGIIQPYCGPLSGPSILRNGSSPADNVGANTLNGCKR